MDFKNYCDNNEQENKSVHINSSKEFNSNAEEIINKYSSYSNSELMDELIKQTNEKKKNGSLDAQKMEQMYQTIYNVIPPEKRQNLDEIFRRLR